MNQDEMEGEEMSTPDTLVKVAQGWAVLQSCQHR